MVVVCALATIALTVLVNHRVMADDHDENDLEVRPAGELIVRRRGSRRPTYRAPLAGAARQLLGVRLAARCTSTFHAFFIMATILPQSPVTSCGPSSVLSERSRGLTNQPNTPALTAARSEIATWLTLGVLPYPAAIFNASVIATDTAKAPALTEGEEKDGRAQELLGTTSS